MINQELQTKYNKTNNKYKTLKKSLINTIHKEKDFKELKRTYKQFKILKEKQGIRPDKRELINIKNKINNDDIFNICLLLVFN